MSLVVLSLVFMFGFWSSKISLKENGEFGSKVLLATTIRPSSVGQTGAICGSANGSTSRKKPTKDLCLAGNVVWLDEKGYNGDWNWKCRKYSFTSYCFANVKRGNSGKF